MRLLRLRFVRARAGRARSLDASLPLVALVDCLLCLVFFLLSSFGAEEMCPLREAVPAADHVLALVEAPVVAVSRHAILLDGSFIGDSAATDAGRVVRIEPLLYMLKNKRELFRQVRPREPFPGVVVLAVERQVPAALVKSAFQTAAMAGYPNVSFMVRQR